MKLTKAAVRTAFAGLAVAGLFCSAAHAQTDSGARVLGLKALAGSISIAPIVNSSTAAAFNTALIQAALNKQGNILLNCNGQAQISASLVAYSNTKFELARTCALYQANSTNANMLVNAAYLSAWSSVSGVTWTDGPLASYNLPSHGLSVGDWVLVTNSTAQATNTDSAFIGCFQVVTVTDANNVVLALRRQPAAQTIGTLRWKKADVNIDIEGGIYNYNSANNATSTTPSSFAIIMAGVHNLRVKNIVGTNTLKYIIQVSGTENALIDGVDGQNANSDLVKIMGPAFDTEAWHVSGNGGDDSCSLQTEEPAAYASYDYGHGGDLINDACRWINVSAASSIAIYPDNASYLISGAVIDNISGYGIVGGIAGTQAPIVKIHNELSAGPSAHITDVTISNVFTRNDYNYMIWLEGYNTTIDLLNINNFKTGVNAGSVATPQYFILDSFSSGEIKTMNLQNFAINFGSSASIGIDVSGGNIIRQLNIDHGSVIPGTSFSGQLVQISSPGNIENISMDDDTLGTFSSTLAGLVSVSTSATPSTKIELTNSKINAFDGASCSTACSLVLAGDTIVNASGGVARGAGTATPITLSSLGGNDLTSGAWWVVGAGTPILTFKGNNADIAIDVSATGVKRSPDAIINNTNAALGTLGAAGLVVGDHAAAGSGSWHLMTDPTKTY